MSQIKSDFPSIEKKPRIIGNRVDRLITDLYKGKKKKFNSSVLNMDNLKPFSKEVLKHACKIPHGKVVTYSGLAAEIGKPNAARAVGQVMAHNPFPIIIPCHRVIRADGTLGGFSGGVKMKKHLLRKEGVLADIRGRVS
ncbi:MAG TPA: MGMT family protein [Deltaproteobacteria bacterium]|nr:MGMT family protein [Deltaproteobacteria bacterium]